MKKVDIAKEMMGAAKGVLQHYKGVENIAEWQDKLKELQVTIEHLFGGEDANQDWKQSYAQQQEEYRKESE